MNRQNIPANVRARLEEYGIELDPPSTRPTNAHQIPRKTRDKNNEGTNVSHQQESKNMTMNIPATVSADVLSTATNGAAPTVDPVTSVDVFDALCKRADKLGTLETVERLARESGSIAHNVDAIASDARRLETVEAHAAAIRQSSAAVAANIEALALSLKKKETTLKATLIEGAFFSACVALGIGVGSFIGIKLARRAGLPVPALPVVDDVVSIQA